jgi:hypothetical protein
MEAAARAEYFEQRAAVEKALRQLARYDARIDISAIGQSKSTQSSNRDR